MRDMEDLFRALTMIGKRQCSASAALHSDVQLATIMQRGDKTEKTSASRVLDCAQWTSTISVDDLGIHNRSVMPSPRTLAWRDVAGLLNSQDDWNRYLGIGATAVPKA